jgi:hypothetical protein
MNKDVKSIGMLFLVLFLIGIIVGVTYIGFGYLKETACEQATSDAYWNAGTCQASSTNTTELTVTAVTKIGVVEDILEIVLGLLSLVVVISIFVIVVKAAKSMAGGAGKSF